MRSFDFRSSLARIGLSSSVCVLQFSGLSSCRLRSVFDEDAKDGEVKPDTEEDDVVRLKDGMVGDDKPEERGESSSSSH